MVRLFFLRVGDFATGANEDRLRITGAEFERILDATRRISKTLCSVWADASGPEEPTGREKVDSG